MGLGLIGRLISFARTTRHGAKVSLSKADIGGGAPIFCEHFSSPGDDGFPLPGDYPLLVRINRAGGLMVAGYVDPANQQKAKAGEKRVYARDNAGGEVVELWLKSDGSAILTNDIGSFELQAGGNVIINGVTIDTDGNITTPTNISAANVDASVTVTAATLSASTSLKVADTEMSGHIHGGVQTGSGDTDEPKEPPPPPP